MKKAVAAAAMTASIAGGGIVGALLGVPALSGAQTDDAPTTTTEEAGPLLGFGWKGHRHHGEVLDEALAGLVEKGTITQAQADAVKEAVEAARPKPIIGDLAQAAADALGISVDDLRAAFQDGKTVADLAEEKGVEVQTVIDAMVKVTNEKIDQAVKDGKITEDQAATMKERVADHITHFVNDGPRRGHHPFGRGGRFRMSPPPWANGDAEGSSTSA